MLGGSKGDEAFSLDRNSISHLQPKFLEMFLQHQVPTTGDGAPGRAERLHTYAELNPRQQQPPLVVHSWETAFEELRLHDTVSPDASFRSINTNTCSFIVAEVAIALPQTSYWDKNVECGVALKFNTNEQLSRRTVCYRNTFFNNGRLIAGGHEFHEGPVRRTPDGNDVQLMFGAKFWANVLSGVTREANPSENLRKILVMQEIFGRKLEHEGPLVVVLWTFDVASNRKNGQTTWRRIQFGDAATAEASTAPHNFIPPEHHELSHQHMYSPDIEGSTTLSTVSRCSSLTDYDYNSAMALNLGSWPNTTSHPQSSLHAGSGATDSRQSIPIQPYGLVGEPIDLLRDHTMDMGTFDYADYTLNNVQDAPVPSHFYPTSDTGSYDLGSQDWYHGYPPASLHFGMQDHSKDSREMNHDASGLTPYSASRQHLSSPMPVPAVAQTEMRSFTSSASF